MISHPILILHKKLFHLFSVIGVWKVLRPGSSQVHNGPKFWGNIETKKYKGKCTWTNIKEWETFMSRNIWGATILIRVLFVYKFQVLLTGDWKELVYRKMKHYQLLFWKTCNSYPSTRHQEADGEWKVMNGVFMITFWVKSSSAQFLYFQTGYIGHELEAWNYSELNEYFRLEYWNLFSCFLADFKGFWRNLYFKLSGEK